MTVCIAAICNSWESIVAVSDMRISAGAYSADSLTIKANGLSDHWQVMWAAEDISHVSPIMSFAKAALKGKPNTAEEIESAVVTAFQKHLAKVCTNRFLSRLGLDMERFYDTGAKNLTPETFDDLYRKIVSAELRCQLLVFGFDATGSPHIFTVSDPGDVNHCDSVGFAAIGSGSYAAESMLFYYYCRPITSLSRAIYTACAAKFMSESATDVGTETMVWIMGKAGGAQLLHSPQIEGIRTLWNSGGKPQMPAGVDTEIPKLIEAANETSRRLVEEHKKLG